MMEHNKHNLQLGQDVWLDEKYNNKSVVTIWNFTPNKLYATVYSKDDETKTSWEVMTVRLTPIKSQ